MTDFDQFWHKQSVDKPLFEDLLWSRPENKRSAGKLLIIGGNSHGFSAPAEAYNESIRAGIGTTRVLLPDSIQSLVGKILENGEFAPSTLPSGGFSKQALGELLAHSNWADGVLIAGDLGRNSETTVLIEQYVAKYQGQLALTKDAVDQIVRTPNLIIDRENTLLVLSFAQLQKLAAASGVALTFNMDLIRLVGALHEFTLQHKVAIITKHLDQIIVASNGQLSTTPSNKSIWRIKTASHASVWWLQNLRQEFMALSTAVQLVGGEGLEPS